MSKLPTVILTDFQPIHLSQPIPQTLYRDALAHMICKAKMATTPYATVEEQARITHDLTAQVSKFCVLPEYINARELNAFVPNDDAYKSEFITFSDIDNFPLGMEINARMEENDRLVDQAFKRLYEHNDSPPTHLTHVTSGGYSAPSPPQRFLAARGWANTTVAHVYHMGCFAAFPAVRSAAGAVLMDAALGRQTPSKADIIHSEYFSLHVNLNAQEAEDIISFTLFGDGFIKYSAVPENTYDSTMGGLRIIAIKDVILPNSEDTMTWHLHTHQFALHLAKDVPYYIRNNCQKFAHELCDKAGIDFDVEKNDMAFAIHTGGPKILDFVEEEFGITPEKMELSRTLLFERGNMSSAACPHLWDRIVRDDTIPKGTKVLSLGFGPGLTVAGMIMEKV